jgi:glycosyltransferase involved in cell wall biosynthesis/peptidoglycan/xylan/chitin deacetylase (PgdA/CDA1 family)
MKIWHVGASSNPYRVDGVSRTVWLLSRHQAQLGHEVSLVVDTPPDEAALEIAREANMKLVHVHATFRTYADEIRRLLGGDRPDVVHMHSVFIPRQATMGRVLNEFSIPYIITPHAGLAPQVLRRGVIKKTIYSWLRERPRFMGSAAIALVTPAEERAVRSFIPFYHKPIRWMPNPVEVDKLDPHRWHGVAGEKRIAFLGRFDVLVKGIDILIEIARLLPEIKFDLYGTEDPKTLDWLNRLKQNLPANVAFNQPIFGIEKAEMLSKATMYLQPSRWEGFPVSVAECLFLGVPSVITDTLDLAQLFYQHGLGLVVPPNPQRAAEQIRAAMADEPLMQQWSQHGRNFAMAHFHPAAVANKYIQLYREVIENQPRTARINGHGRGIMPARVRGKFKANVARGAERFHNVFSSNGTARSVVLCYHSVSKSDADLSVDPEVLRQQVSELKEQGFQFYTFGDLVHRFMRCGAPPHDAACITFDDGFEDNLTHAAPILAELGVPATIFVTTGLMSRDEQVVNDFESLTRFSAKYLSSAQVAELSRAGFEIAAHTHRHQNMARLAIDAAREEIVRSKTMLEQVTGKSVRTFAYPFGKRNIHYTNETISLVRDSGLEGAAAVAFRAVTPRASIRMFEVPRFFITRADSPEVFRQKVAGHYDWLGTIQETTPNWMKALVSPEDRY